jgi:hypothetical protein
MFSENVAFTAEQKGQAAETDIGTIPVAAYPQQLDMSKQVVNKISLRNIIGSPEIQLQRTAKPETRAAALGLFAQWQPLASACY